jgi:hypothetical protein
MNKICSDCSYWSGSCRKGRHNRLASSEACPDFVDSLRVCVCVRECVYGESLYTLNPGSKPSLLNDSLIEVCECVCEGEVVEGIEDRRYSIPSIYIQTHSHAEVS